MDEKKVKNDLYQFLTEKLYRTSVLVPDNQIELNQENPNM